MDEAQLERCLGFTYLNVGRLDDAAACFGRAIAGFSEHGQARDTIAGIGGLGILRAVEGRFEEARSYLRRVLGLAQDAGLRMHEALAWGNLGALCVDLEDWDGAQECARNALAVANDQGQVARPQVHICLARAAEGRGQYDEATEHALASLDLASAYDDAIGQVHALEVLASIHHRLGRYEEAVQSLENTLQTHRRHCRAQLVAQVLNTLGCTYLDAASPSLARDRHAEARRYAERAGSRLQVSRALLGLGDAHVALGEPVAAQSYWQQALTAYAQMQHPAADRVLARLAT